MACHEERTDLHAGAVIGLPKGSCVSGSGFVETAPLAESTARLSEANQYAKSQFAAGISRKKF